VIIFKGFQGLENFYIKFKDFPYFFRICTNPVLCKGTVDLYCMWLVNHSLHWKMCWSVCWSEMWSAVRCNRFLYLYLQQSATL